MVLVSNPRSRARRFDETASGYAAAAGVWADVAAGYVGL